MKRYRQRVCIGVLALQGAFSEHLQLLRRAFAALGLPQDSNSGWTCVEVRTSESLATCDALIIPGGESTTISLIAQRSGLMQPLRQFVKAERKPTWGTCAGLILLAESANRTKKGGQDLVGGLDVRVNRNYFGRQIESFETLLSLPFLQLGEDDSQSESFKGVFIRAPIVEKISPPKDRVQVDEEAILEIIVAPYQAPKNMRAAGAADGKVEVMARLPGRTKIKANNMPAVEPCEGDVIAVKQGNVFGTCFHPELTTDPRIHIWWLRGIIHDLQQC